MRNSKIMTFLRRSEEEDEKKGNYEERKDLEIGFGAAFELRGLKSRV
jgi:hypothetical protein